MFQRVDNHLHKKYQLQGSLDYSLNDIAASFTRKQCKSLRTITSRANFVSIRATQASIVKTVRDNIKQYL